MPRLQSVTLAILPAVLAGPAAAQTGTPAIDLAPLVQALADLLIPVIGAVATFLINAQVKNRQLAEMLSNAVQNSLGVVQQRTSAAIKGADLTVTVDNTDIQAGVRYVLQNAEEAVRHFKIPTERIAQKIEAKLGLASIATNLATTASPTKVIAGPMAPIPLGRMEF
jgi:hypothetical protein